MADLLAAFLYAQLEQADVITAQREKRFKKYLEAFSPYQERGLLQLPHLPGYARSNYHLFYMLCPTRDHRDQILSQLRQEGIEATFHFVPLHSAPMGRKLGYKLDDLPLTEEISGRLIRLPLYPDLTATEQDYIIDKVRDRLRTW